MELTDTTVTFGLTAAAGALLGLLVGLIAGRFGRSALQQEVDAGKTEVRDILKQAEENRRALVKARRELNTVSSLALHLPNVVRELNRDDVDPAEVPELIRQLVNAIFQPEQILLYGVHQLRDGDGPKRPVLRISMKQGYRELPQALHTITPGSGRIGWVAAHQLDMLDEDWTKLKRTEGVDVPSNHAGMPCDIIGPLMQHSGDRHRVLGVLCIGKPRIRPRDEKLMFQLVTNFGSLAIVSSTNLDKLRSMANNDGLTELLNKRSFLGRDAIAALVECEKLGKPLTIFIFDIDHFKNYNDTNGHPAGDELLRDLSQLIRDSVRPGDMACRYGGEEFVIAMPDTDKEKAFELADALRAKIAETEFAFRENQPSGIVSISGGVAAFPRDGQSVAELVERADQSLYCSKKSGRNRITAYRPVEIGAVSDDATDVPDRPETVSG